MLPTAGQLVPKEGALSLKAAERKEGEGGVWKECTQNEWTVSTNPHPNPLTLTLTLTLTHTLTLALTLALTLTQTLT